LRRIYTFTFTLTLILLFTACSRKKNTFLSRNYHAVTAEYNAIFNGDVALDNGQKSLALTYTDNFWEILPVERFEVKEEIFYKPGQKPKNGKSPSSGSSGFERAEEKAAKAIQKHSIYIDGKEYNPQIDEAYMLLGKARYYDQRFVAAQDAFNFILNRYATSNNVNEARMWKAKTKIRLGNEEGAIEELTELMEKKDGLSTEDLADAAAVMAQAYINLDTLEAALPMIKTASEFVKDKELQGRYLFIKGQIYNRLEEKDSANMAFQEVIELNRKSPRVYMINAYMQQMKNFEYDKGDRVALLELLRDLEKNRENRPFLDLIHHQFGEYYRNTEDIDSAVLFYNKSIRGYRDNKYLQSVNYSTLAEIYFDQAEYKTAGKYYDSTLTFLEENTRPWRRMKKKLDNLADVIKYEDIAAENDSILRLANMSETQQLEFFTKYVEKLKEQARLDSIAKIEAEEAIANKEFYQKESRGDGGNSGGKFYFYNSSTVAYGKGEFTKIWGNRVLEDYWRLSNKQRTSNADAGDTESETAEAAVDNSEKFDPQAYIATLPTDPKVLDSLTKDRNFAYYQLGLIYKEKFREYNLAIDRLETLLGYNPEERLVLPAKYNLHKIYALLENEAQADKWKNDIISNHPDSRYAEILLNPSIQLEQDESSPEARYKALYAEYEKQRYDYVIATTEDYIKVYTGTDLVPKLEMLKATALGRRDGFEAYKKGVNFVALNYPQSPEGKEAQNIYSKTLPILAKKEFVSESEQWKVVYTFRNDEMEEATALEEKLEEAIKEYNYFKMSASVDYYDPDTIFVVIHGLNTKLGGRGFAEVLKENKKYKIKKPFFEIASENYKVVQIHKALTNYLAGDNTVEENNNPQK